LILFGVMETTFVGMLILLYCETGIWSYSGSAVGSTYSLVRFTNVKLSSKEFTRQVMEWNLSIYVLSLMINLLLSSLICIKFYQAGRRIERIQRVARHAHTTRYYSLLLSYIESGSIYPTLMIVCLITYITKTFYGWVIIKIAPQVLAIMPTLMFLVVLLKKQSLFESQETGSTSQTLSMPSWVLRSSAGPHIVAPLSSDVADESNYQINNSTREEFKLTDLAAPAAVHIHDIN
jgi:hypothetical protein